MPERNSTSSLYNYGFNGMLADDEVKNQTKSSYDFGARMYDARLGRWWAVDPNEDSYPGISLYNYALNSPIIIQDYDGRDVRVTVVENEDGSGGIITLETTVHVYGKGAADLVSGANKKFKKLNNTYTYIHPSTKKEWKVIIDVKFRENQELGEEINGKHPSEFYAKDFDGKYGLQSGDNIICKGCPVTKAKSENVIEKVYNNSTAGGAMGDGLAVHVAGHFIGIEDSYGFDSDYYKEDISHRSVNRIDDIHFINIVENERILNPFTGALGISFGEKASFDAKPMRLNLTLTSPAKAQQKVNEQNKLKKGSEGAHGAPAEAPTEGDDFTLPGADGGSTGSDEDW